MSCPTIAFLDEDLTFTVQIFASTGAPADADGNVSYSVYEEETATAIATGTMAKLASQTGFYSEKISLTQAIGYERLKTYQIRITAAVAGISVAKVYTFMVLGTGDITEAGSSIVSLDDVKSYLHITITDDDTLLNAIILRVSEEAETYCNRSFVAADYVEYYDGNGSNSLLLKQYPINTVTSIYDDIDHDYGAATLIASTEYILYENEGIVMLEDSVFDKGNHNIKVTYNAGYSTLPGDLYQAIIMLIAAHYIVGQTSLNAIQGDELVPDRASKLKARAYEILDRYRKIA